MKILYIVDLDFWLLIILKKMVVTIIGIARAEKCTKLISNCPGFMQVHVEFLLRIDKSSLTAPRNTLRSTLVNYLLKLILKEYLYCSSN